MKLLLRHRHGIGDAVQLGIVIKHLKHYHPQWFVGVETKPGMASCLHGVADAYHDMIHPFTWHKDYEKIMHLPYPRPERSYNLGVPSGKALRCLLEYFPECMSIEEFFYYDIHPSDVAVERVSKYIDEELHGEPFGMIHYRGTSSAENKNLEEGEVAVLGDALYDRGLRTVILDFGGHCVFAEKLFTDDPAARLNHLGQWHSIWPPHPKGMGDAGVMAELIRRAEVFCGIDSGPAFLANAVGTEGHCFWFNHHPIYCHDLDRGNMTHYVPDYLDELLNREGDPIGAKAYFEKRYKHVTYSPSLEAYLIDHYEDFSGGVSFPTVSA